MPPSETDHNQNQERFTTKWQNTCRRRINQYSQNTDHTLIILLNSQKSNCKQSNFRVRYYKKLKKCKTQNTITSYKKQHKLSSRIERKSTISRWQACADSGKVPRQFKAWTQVQQKLPRYFIRTRRQNNTSRYTNQERIRGRKELQSKVRCRDNTTDRNG